MAVRTTLLALSSVLVLGGLVYVAVEVRAKPLDGTIVPTTTATHAAEPEADATSGSGHPAPRPRGRAGSAGSSIAAGARGADNDRAPALGAAAADGLRLPGAGRPGTLAGGGAGDDGEPADLTGSRAGEASRLYDQREYDEAIKLSQAILASEPDNVRVMRVLISSACASGDVGLANTYYAKLTRVKDKRDMKKRCERFGAVIEDASVP